jgi:hypothetical protein
MSIKNKKFEGKVEELDASTSHSARSHGMAIHGWGPTSEDGEHASLGILASFDAIRHFDGQVKIRVRARKGVLTEIETDLEK